MSVAVIGQFRFPPERMARARAEMAKLLEATRAEAGCRNYCFAEDVLDPRLVRVSEIWESFEQLVAHVATPHVAAWGELHSELGLTDRSITVLHVSREQQA